MTTKKRTLYLIHHSHTDIGYTDSQEKISRYHVDFIRDLLNTFDAIDAGKTEWAGYTYTCENFWQVEEFYRQSTLEEQTRFEQRVKEGKIEVSLSFLNMNELVDDEMIRHKFTKAKQYLTSLGVNGTSAMTADINGFSWGYAEAMAECGVENFYSCLHTHHGIFPLYQKQIPFWWETKKGNKILVWNGDHYQVGNTFFLTPNSDFTKQYPNGYGDTEADEQFKQTEEKIFAYFNNLDKQGYPYSFVPEMLSGVITDNSPINPRMMEIIHRWNDTHGDNIEIVLTTLDAFFKTLREADQEIPTYKGDWPDWWADGSDSTPAFIKIYRDAQRKYHLSNKLDPTGELGNPAFLEDAEEQMLMFTEHSWGHAASISHPWDSQVNEVDFKNSAYAINAHTLITKNLIEITSKLGEKSPSLNRELLFKVVNPHDAPVTDYTKVQVAHWENVDGSFYNMNHTDDVEVIDCKTGEVYPVQMEPTTRGFSLEFLISLDSKETRQVKVRSKKKDYQYPLNNLAIRAADNVEDIADYDGYVNTANTHKIITDYYYLKFDENGISSLIDRKTNTELVHPDAIYRPFEGIYEKTEMAYDACTSRRILGRNRKGRTATRDVSRLKELKIVSKGPVFTMAELTYELPGTYRYQVLLKMYHKSPKILVSVRIMKTYEWAPENVYISLPFSYGRDYTLKAEKSGSIFRPAIDQIPGTNIDYYLLNNGLSFVNDQNALIVTTKDAPLIWLGDLKHHEIELAGPNSAYKNKELVYSWPMNNFWETNFKAELAGSYEFEYQLYLTHDHKNEEQLFEIASELNQGLITFPC
ncbi:hypothetical protein [Vagococcus fluvialis]|uniref:glycoside hydrolase family 38 N-terminal domain-containing protein n=1 Tax=Vagococcus fluvialis TaxID=2738 RepID=UPI003B5C5A69